MLHTSDITYCKHIENQLNSCLADAIAHLWNIRLEPDFVEYKCATSGSGPSMGTLRNSATERSSTCGIPVTMYASLPCMSARILFRAFGLYLRCVLRHILCVYNQYNLLIVCCNSTYCYIPEFLRHIYYSLTILPTRNHHRHRE